MAGELLAESLTLKDDGRIDVDTGSRIVKSVLFLPKFQSPPSQPHIQPPAYSLVDAQTTGWHAFPVKLNIVIQVVGSRGDVQPFIALGNELQKHGHRVRLATHNVFDSFVRSSGLEFYPIGGDPAELMAYMVRNPGLIPSMTSLRAGDIQKKRKMMAEMLDGCWLSCIEPDPVTSTPFVADAIIANPPSFAHLHCAQALGIPVHIMFTMPWTSTRAFPHPLANIKVGHDSGIDPQMVNYSSYLVVESLTWQGLGDVINEWRDTLDLEPVAFSDGPRLAEMLKIPFTYCWSPSLIPKPADWDSHISVCGFFFREPPDYAPPPELDEFLRGGPPPIYIGFGSIVIDDPEKVTATLLEAVRRTGVRALISRGWSNLGGTQAENVFYLGDCPHEWLFQRVVAVIHHGGAGTTACGLLNGLPTMIVPFFGDQPFWGEMVAAAGAGPKPIPSKSLNVESLVEAIQYCLTPEASEAAQAIAAKMRAESGVKAAVSSFNDNLPVHELECDVIKGQPAVWTYRGKHAHFKLSKVAAEILARHLRIDPSKLKMHETRPIVIETRRWDPVTGTVSAAVGVGSDMLRAAADIVIRPAKVYQDRQKTQSFESPTERLLSSTETSSAHSKRKKARSCMDIAGGMTVASASGIGNLFKHSAGGLVSIPFAFTEGFRNLPRLYGEEVRDYGTIQDWKSGTVAGAKALAYGVFDGVAGMFILPYKDYRREGPVGIAKGLGKGIVGISSKLFTATMGVATYPLQGIYKSIWASAKSKTRHSILRARRTEGAYLARNASTKGIADRAVMDAFDVLKHGSRSMV